ATSDFDGARPGLVRGTGSLLLVSQGLEKGRPVTWRCRHVHGLRYRGALIQERQTRAEQRPAEPPGEQRLAWLEARFQRRHLRPVEGPRGWGRPPEPRF